MPRMDMATAMLVALDDHVAGAAITVLDDAGFRVIRVKHVAPALERIPVVMPQLVIAPANLHPEEEEPLTDRCVAIGAEVLRVAPDIDPAALDTLVTRAAHAASTRRR